MRLTASIYADTVAQVASAWTELAEAHPAFI
jgi:hypothetical protein